MSMAAQSAYSHVAADPAQLLSTWPMSAPNHLPAVSLGPLDTNTAFQPATYDSYGASFQTSPQEFIAPQQSSYIQEEGVDQTAYDALSLGLEVNSGIPYNGNAMTFQANLGNMPNVQAMNINWPEVHQTLADYMGTSPIPAPLFTGGFALGSPSDDSFDIASCTSGESSSWGMMQAQPLVQTGFIHNPEQTLHPRSWSDSSSEKDQHQTGTSWDESYVNIPSGGLDSPSSESGSHSSENSFYMVPNPQPSPPTLTTTTVKPIAMRRQSSQKKSPTSPTSARNARFSKTPIVKQSTGTTTKATTAAVKRAVGVPAGKEESKRVGRRKGPLSADQRKQASEIRKLGACIRCRFLKKTCDKGEPCAGCQPSHARLWLVPCTRVDIKDLGYFIKGWKVDYERHVTCGVSVSNIKGFSDQEQCLFITHGYGHYIPLKAREVFVRDESVFLVDWIESHSGSMETFMKETARLSAGADGVPHSILHEYLDHHIDSGFEFFVDEHFQGTPFVTELLKIAYRFYAKEKTPVIRNALKFVLAYNLTQSICLLKGFPYESEAEAIGHIDDARSEFNGQVVAPMMINFQVKTAMAELWRELQKSLLEDLSTLYSSIYSKDKLKNWPTIFMLASLLLVVWEEMQFDSRYREQDQKVADKFCHDMESTPVGVIVGLFSAISQKVPAFSEWDTQKHHALLGSNPNVCDAMEEVCTGVQKHDKYLRTRQANKVKFDREDFDCFSNMFISKLVIKSH